MNNGFLVLGVLALAGCKMSLAAPKATTLPAPLLPVFEKDNHIPFQGDSITDGNRGRGDDPNHILGIGKWRSWRYGTSGMLRVPRLPLRRVFACKTSA
jgi:hypothetical protein